jgi:glycerol-3-phosphate acyltransferase PlsY
VIEYLVFVPLGYLLGAIPFGFIAGKLFGGVDVRDHGSGSIGMTNVMRTVSPPVAILVLALDMGKAIGAVILARIIADAPLVETLTGIAVIAGHSWSVFIGFSGGKGTATGWGALFALSPIAGIVASVIGVGLIALTRYVSLGSIVAATLGAITLAVIALVNDSVPLEYALYGAVGAAIILFKHRDNIQRLIRGDERKLGQKVDTAAPGSTDNQRGKGLRWPRSA